MTFFDGFEAPSLVTVDGEPVRFRRAGHGPAVLLLHGHPQTHAMWHAVAPMLARSFDVICPDLPGYGGSRPAAGSNAPPGTSDSLTRRILAFLDALGVGAVQVVGHDRGGRVAQRLATGWPERVRSLALLDLVPTPAAVEREDMAFALATYRMFWFAQTHPKPEALFHEEPKIWLPGTLPGQAAHGQFHHEAVADYLAGLPDSEAMSDLNVAYRDAVERDAAEERMGRLTALRITCPVLVLWGSMGRIGGWYDPVELWRQRSEGPVTGCEIEAGHFLAEESPDEVGAALLRFLSTEG